MAGRPWQDDYIDLQTYLRRRDVPRLARQAAWDDAQMLALLALVALMPKPRRWHSRDVLVQLRHRARDREALNLAALVYLFLSSHIPRPLRDTTHETDTICFERWTTSREFAISFRVASHEQLLRLAKGLRMPSIMRGQRWPRRAPGEPAPAPIPSYSASGIDALAVCLARLAFPGRLESLCLQLNLSWSISKMSAIINATIRHINHWFGPRLLYDQRIFTDHQRLRIYADSISRCGGPFSACVGFIDGTTVHICRPGGQWEQLVVYSGHKRHHCLRYQAVTLPDGLIGSFYGPCPGASNDRSLLNASELDSRLHIDFGPSPQFPLLANFYLYGDGGYGGGELVTVVTAADLPNEHTQDANSVRVSVENVLVQHQ